MEGHRVVAATYPTRNWRWSLLPGHLRRGGRAAVTHYKVGSRSRTRDRNDVKSQTTFTSVLMLVQRDCVFWRHCTTFFGRCPAFVDHTRRSPLHLVIGLGAGCIVCTLPAGCCPLPWECCHRPFGCRVVTSCSFHRETRTAGRAPAHPVGLCTWDFECKGAGPPHKCAYCRKPQMHPACHATCGLPDGVHTAADLPAALKGLAPTCTIFCQLCAINRVVGVGGKAKEVAKMERLWKKKMMTLQQAVKAYKVGHTGTPPLTWPSRTSPCQNGSRALNMWVGCAEDIPLPSTQGAVVLPRRSQTGSRSRTRLGFPDLMQAPSF